MNQDDGYTTVNLGFTFPYYGENYSKIAISANGRIVPLKNSDPNPTSPDFSNRIQEGIHPYNDDLYPTPFNTDLSGAWFKTTANTATITWVMVAYAHRASSESSTEIRVQAKLQSTGQIEFHYIDTHTGDSSYDYATSASIGLAPTSNVSGEKLTVSHNTANQSEAGNSKALKFVRTGSIARVHSDYDGDGLSDIVVYRDYLGMWYILTSGTNFNFANHLTYQLGLPGDIPLAGDFDGDGKTDLVVWRASNGTWYFRNSSTNFNTITSIQWGLRGDTPLVGDYDGDDKSDLVVYRPASGMFYALLSGSGFNRNAALANSNQAVYSIPLGGFANDPVVGDFNGDGKDDFAVIWQLIRFWSIKNSSNQLLSSLPWGEPGDTPLGCDWDGDGVTDRVITRINKNFTLNWYAVTAGNLVYTSNFGSIGDKPSCDKDFDGDGKGDMAVYRNWSGQWFVKLSSTGQGRVFSFGLPGDTAI
jgi:hypothetical protein